MGYVQSILNDDPPLRVMYGNGIIEWIELRRRSTVTLYRLLSLPEPDRHCEAAVTKCFAFAVHGAHFVERVTPKEHDAVIDRGEFGIRPRARAAGRCDPGVVQF